MSFWKYHLLLPVTITVLIMNMFGLVSSKYIYHELNEDLKPKLSFNFTLFIKTPTGIILYAIDSSNKILIEMINDLGESMLIIKYNDLKITKRLATLCGCEKCTSISIGFYIDLKPWKCIVHCQEKPTMVHLSKKVFEDQFSRYPIPNDYYHRKNKTYIWMGNIGPYRGFDKVVYHPMKSILLGCLDRLYINNKLINMKSNRTSFKVCCQQLRNECSEDKSSNKSISQRKFDWKMLEKKRKFCTIDLLENNSHGQSFVIDNKSDQPVALILEYKLRYHNKSSDYGLMEIQLQDESLVLFHISHYNEVVMSTRRNGSYYDVTYTQKISPKLNNTLFIGSTHQNLFIKLSSIDGIKCHQEKLIATPVLINVGFFQHTSIIAKFEGIIGFNCTWPQCLPLGESRITEPAVGQTKNHFYLITIIFTLIILLAILIFSFVMRKSKQNPKKKDPIPKVNKENSNEYEFELPQIPLKDTRIYENLSP